MAMDDFEYQISGPVGSFVLPRGLKIRRRKLNRLLVLLGTIVTCYIWLQRCARTIIGYELRMVAIGDSITLGFGSSTLNGYRGPLLGYLIGDTAYFIGSERNGEMYYNYHEGRPGQRINTTLQAAAWALSERPNIILLHIGSNDIVSHDRLATAPQRVGNLIEGIFSFCPDATLLIARIGPVNHTGFAPQYEDYNNNVAAIVETWRLSDHHVMMVDLPKGINMEEDFIDNTHPNNIGYKKYAHQWYQAILEAYKRDWIRDPVPVDQIEGVFYANQQGTVEVGTLPEIQTESTGTTATDEATTNLTPDQIHALLEAKLENDPYGRLVRG